MSKFGVKMYNFFFYYPTPGNLTNVWNFGVIAFFFLIVQMITGMILSLYYVPVDYIAFNYVEYMNSDTIFGWYVSYLHANGASLFFFFVYLHFFSSLYYFNFVSPKVAVWNFGVMILLLMMITAFTGYVLPRGQMSFWAATVITNLISVMPFIGEDLLKMIWGSFSVSSFTLNSMFSLHFFLPFMISFMVLLHFMFLHELGSKNGLSLMSKSDKITFNPFYTFKDFLMMILVILLYVFMIKFVPNYLGHADNYMSADPLTTPAHMMPEWYFLVFYAMLSSVPSKGAGVVLLALSVIVLFFFPTTLRLYYPKNYKGFEIDLNDMDSMNSYVALENKTLPGLYSICFWLFVIDFVGLSYMGMQPIEHPYSQLGLVLTMGYFAFFIYMMIIFEVQLMWKLWKKMYKLEKESVKFYYSSIKKGMNKLSEFLKKIYEKYFKK